MKRTVGFFLILFIGLCLAGTVSADEFCATLEWDSTNVGWIAVNIDGNGRALWDYHLDLSSVDFPPTCFANKPITEGFNYHVHSFWDDQNTFSPSTCGTTGGHYDPSLACGPKSQNIGTLCASLNRIAPLYNYTCSRSSFLDNGLYNLCEAGDLSGKFGKVTPESSDNLIYDTDVIEDPFPLQISDYRADSIVTIGWSSINFHCQDSAGTRFLCGKFVPRTADSPCPSLSFSSASISILSMISFVLMTIAYFF